MFVAALFRLDGVPLNAGDGAVDGVAVKVGQLHAGQGQDGHIAVGQEVDVARVVQHAGHIRSHKGLALAHADDHGRTKAGGHNLVRLGGRQNPQRKGPGQPLDRAADGHFQRNRLAGCFGVLLHLLNEVGDDLGVGFGDELVAQRDKLVL